MKSNKDKESILKSASATHRLQKRLKQIFDSWPNLKKSTFNFLDYIHEDLLSQDGQPLLAKCLLTAVEKYDACESKDIGSTTQMFSYLNGLLQHSYEFANYHIANNKTPPESWEPFDQSVLDFVEKNKGASIHNEKYVEANRNSIRLMLLARIINVRDLQTIESKNQLTEFFADEHLAAH